MPIHSKAYPCQRDIWRSRINCMSDGHEDRQRFLGMIELTVC